MSSPQTIADDIWNQSVDRVIDLSDEIQSLFEQNGISQYEAIEKADKILGRVRDLIAQKINYYARKRVKPNFCFSDTSPNKLIGIAMSEADSQLREKLLHRHELLNYISTLNWKTFEKLCAILLVLSGFSRYHVDTGKRTKDGGLDFFGVLPLEDRVNYSGCMNDEHYRVFGQAKHHQKTNPVSGEEVRVFFTKFNDFNGKVGPAYKYICLKHAWFIAMRGVIVPMVVTNTRFADDAEWYANEKQIRLREGINIAEDIVMLAEANDWLRIEEGRYVFAPDKFNTYLDTYPFSAT